MYGCPPEDLMEKSNKGIQRQRELPLMCRETFELQPWLRTHHFIKRHGSWMA